MKQQAWALAGLLTLNSCGLSQWWTHAPSEKERAMASLTMQQLVTDDELGFNEEIQQKLLYLHYYYLIGQKNLIEFDAAIPEQTARDLLQSVPYLNLLAVRTQTEEIEHELLEVWAQPNKSSSGLKKKLQLKDLILKFSSRSKLCYASMENLLHQLEVEGKSPGLSAQEIDSEVLKLETTKEFQILEKNIEHLSHVMETKIDKGHPAFAPSVERSGNITGDEFPRGVWSITFDDGPTKVTGEILSVLSGHNVQATFFQLASQAEIFPEVTKDLKKQGMSIGSHSWDHQQLTKVGGTTLHKEIHLASKRLEEIQGAALKFYRLPYGAGVSVEHVRQKIADAGLIHALWNVDAIDWIPQGPDKIVARTIKLMGKTSKDAGIILFHDVHHRTTRALPMILKHLKENGRRTCSLDQIVNDINEGSDSVCVKK